jgi:5-methylcytosine-specific restriction endonuclease McrA
MARDYSYDTAYEKSPKQRHNRSLRNKARRLLIKKYGKAAVAGKDVDHKHHITGTNPNRLSNLQILSKHANRAKH